MKKTFYRKSKFGPILAYKLGLGPQIGKVVLLLTTTGRKTGLKRITPLQYDCIDGVYHVGAVFGLKSVWVRNIQIDPRGQMSTKGETFDALAEISTDPEELADLVEYRMNKHPRMIGLIMKLDGFKFKPTREELVEYCQDLVLVRVTPCQPGNMKFVQSD